MREPEYTNGRIRVRPEQIDYLDNLLHRTWVDLSRARAKMKAGEHPEVSPPMDEPALITHMNRELRLISSIQEELRRTKDDMGL